MVDPTTRRALIWNLVSSCYMLIDRITGMVKVAPWQPFAELVAIDRTFGKVTEVLVALAATVTAEPRVNVV